MPSTMLFIIYLLFFPPLRAKMLIEKDQFEIKESFLQSSFFCYPWRGEEGQKWGETQWISMLCSFFKMDWLHTPEKRIFWSALQPILYISDRKSSLAVGGGSSREQYEVRVLCYFIFFPLNYSRPLRHRLTWLPPSTFHPTRSLL